MEYKHFSYYYDVMMENINYNIFTEIVCRLIDKENRLLDLGCGTGTVLLELLKLGYDVDGVDLSEDMLEVAKSKLIRNDLDTNLFLHDITEPFSPKTYNVIISFLDVINYIKDFKLVFKNIFNSLTDDGLFIFDVDTPEYIKMLNEYEENEQYEYFSYTWKCMSGEEDDSIIHMLEITDGDELYSERHYQRTYSFEIYKEALLNVGFKKVVLLEESDKDKNFILAMKTD